MFTFVAVIAHPARSTALCAFAIGKIAGRLVTTVSTHIAARFSKLPLDTLYRTG